MVVQGGAVSPQVGEALYLLPRHVCPTVNNFDCALLVQNGEVKSVEKVSARGRETPLLQAADKTLHVTG
jgi:D-serine deaminase-like pyridoxal phosphate-dependent protein